MKLATVGDVSMQIRGVSYDKSVIRTQPSDGYLPLLRGGNIGDHGLVWSDLQYVPESIVNDAQVLRKGDIVLAASSGSLSAVGKAARFDRGTPTTFGAFCKVLRPNESVDAGYFGHYFKTASYRSQVSRLAEGANINNLRKEHLDNLAFPVPPLEEQRRIAAILDKADELRARRRQALAHLDTLTQSIFHSMFERGAFASKPLGSVAKFFGGNSLPVGENFTDQSGGYLLLKVSDMNREGNEQLLRTSGLWSGMPGSKASTCPEGCIVIPKRGASISTNKKRLTVRPSVLDPNLMAVQPQELLDAAYVYAWFEKFDLTQITSGSSVPQLNKQDLQPLPIPVPPLELQQTFATRVAAVERLKESHRKHLAELDSLFAALQHRAFKGEL